MRTKSKPPIRTAQGTCSLSAGPPGTPPDLRAPALERVDVAEPVGQFGHEIGGGRSGHADPGGRWANEGDGIPDTRPTGARAMFRGGNRRVALAPRDHPE
jgi:hypothetical protein